MNPQDWKLWQRVPKAQAIADALKNIPAHWNLTPLRDKAAFRPNWQTEPFINHNNFTTWLLDGEEKISSKGFKPYRAYISGYGLRTGDSSNGLVALDVDGASAEPVLKALSNGDLPQTVSWTSGKPGRRQLLFQVPDEYRGQLVDFNRSVITEHNGVRTADGEILELRYNKCQSVLPPSRHPQTGAYHWLNSPTVIDVAIAPAWLCELLQKLANQEKQAELARAREAEAARESAEVRRHQRQQSLFVGTPPLEIFLTRNDQDLINSGTGQGNRDNAGFKLAANIIATCDRLQVLGIPFDGDGQGLFEEYAVRCSPPLSSRDINRIWKSASKKSFASLNDDQLEKRFSYWQWEQNPNKDSYLEPDRIEYEKYCQWEEEQERILKAQILEHECKERKSISDLIKEAYNKVASKLCKRTGLLPDNPQPNPQPNPQQKPVKTDAIVLLSDWHQWLESNTKPPIIPYKPGELISEEEWSLLGCPKIRFEVGDRKKLIKELYQKWEKPRIFESSDTGLGKSHNAGELTSDYLTNGEGRVCYNDPNHRNPTTPTVEQNFTDQISRSSNGFVYDHERETASGYPHVVRPKDGQVPDIKGNCPETETFLLLNQDKNLITLGGENSPICEKCKHYKDGEDVVCGFILARRDILQGSPQVRQHLLQSIPGKTVAENENDKKDSEDKAPPFTVFIVEEIGATLNPYKNVLATKKDLTHAYQELKQKDSKLAQVVEPLHDALYALLNVDEMPEYGYDFVALRRHLLPTIPKIYANASELLWDRWLKYGWDWEDGIPKTTFWEFIIDSISRTLRPNLEAMLHRGQSPEQKQAVIRDNVALNWISLALEAVIDNEAHLRVDQFGLHITEYNWRYHSIMTSYKLVLMMDSTLTKNELAVLTKFKKSDIVEIQQVKPDYSNYKFTIINGIGSCSKKRRAKGDFDLQVRVERTVGKIHAHHKILGHKTIGVIDHQLFANNYWGYEEADTEIKSGYWGRDNRNSNEFMRCKALILIGTPLPNLGQAAAEYHALTNNVVRPVDLFGGYGHYVRSRAKAETYQGIGRSRAHLKPEPTHIYLIGNEAVTESDLMQRYPGCTVNEIDIYDFCPEAAPKGVQTDRGFMATLVNAIKGNAPTGSKNIAAQIGVGASRVRQIGKEILEDLGIEGGFSQLKSLLVLLIDTFKAKLTPLEELDDELRWLAETYLPLFATEEPTEAIKEFLLLGKAYGWKTFKKVLTATDAPTLCHLLKIVLDLVVPSLDLELPEGKPG